MKYKKGIYKGICISIFWIVLGAGLTLFAGFGDLDGYWSGMGGAFVTIGIIQVIRHVRYAKDEAYREKVDTENNDERNRFIANRAWAWAGYLYVIIGAVATIILRVVGSDEFSQVVGMSICLILVLYWCSYMFLRKRY